MTALAIVLAIQSLIIGLMAMLIGYVMGGEDEAERLRVVQAEANRASQELLWLSQSASRAIDVEASIYLAAQAWDDDEDYDYDDRQSGW